MSKDSSKPVPEVPNADKSKLGTIRNTVSRVPWNPWLGVVFVILAYYLSQIFASIIVSIYPSLKQWSSAEANEWLTNSVGAQFCYVLIAEVFLLGAIYIFLKHYHTNFKIIGFKRPRWRDIGYGLMAVPVYYVLYLITVGLANQFIPGLDINQKQEIGFDNVQGLGPLILTFTSLVILPPLVEEIMVRGFLYSSLKKGLPTLAAVITTSAIFASAHLPAGGANGLLYIAALDTFILSLVLIYLREKTGSLWASITLHAFKNGVAFMVLFVFMAT